MAAVPTTTNCASCSRCWESDLYSGCILRLAATVLFVSILSAQHRGGSNYAWYRVDANCVRNPYGIIPNYDTARAEIDQQLEAMFHSGQRRLRIPVYHGHHIAGGTNMESDGGNLTPRCRENFRRLLETIHRIGFSEIVIGFFPQGPNNPARWTAFQPDIFEENWQIIASLRPLISAAKIRYRIDLWNEGSPGPRQPIMLEYCQRLWNQYAAAYGTRDTVGFSIIPSEDRFQLLRALYGDSPFGNHGRPPALDIHFYKDAAARFASAHSLLRAAGFRQPWILGESYYNDAAEAQTLRQAIRVTHQKILFLLQWPLTSDAACRDVSLAPPGDFSNYRKEGF